MANVRQSVFKNIQGNRIKLCLCNLFTRGYRSCLSYFQSMRPQRDQSRQDNQVFERQLESSGFTHNSSILLSSQGVHRRSSKNVGLRKTAKESEPTRTNIEKEEQRTIRVPTQTLLANHHIYFTFNNLRYRDSISFHVESEYPVNTYLVDDEGFNNFREGNEFTYYGGFRNQREHQDRIRVPHEGNWYLIIDNPQYQSTAIHYEVYG